MFRLTFFGVFSVPFVQLGGGRGATFGREVVRAPLSPAHAGRRVLSAVQNEVGDGDEAEEGEGNFCSPGI